MSEFSKFTPLVQSLPATVPFVGPETQERQAGRMFRGNVSNALHASVNET